MRKTTIMLACVISLCFISCASQKQHEKQDDNEKEARYNEAFVLVDKGDYTAAYEMFSGLGNYKDSEEQMQKFQYIAVKRLITFGDQQVVGEVILNEDNLPAQIANHYETNRSVFDFSYDESGNLIQEIYDNFVGGKTVYDYTYDEKNKLIKEVCTFSDGNVNTFNYTYDKQGNLVKALTTYYNGDEKLQEYKYDSFGRRIQEIYESRFDDLIHKRKYDYTYDVSGNLIKEIQTHDDGKTSGHEFVYDNDGHLLKRIDTTYSGALYLYECTYDVNGNLIKEIYVDSKGDKEIYDAVYDAEGNLTEGGYTAQDADREVYRRAYYEEGKLIKDVYTDSVSDYTYDEHGNLIRKSLSMTSKTDVFIEYEYEFVYIRHSLPQEVAQSLKDFCENWYSFEKWVSEDPD